MVSEELGESLQLFDPSRSKWHGKFKNRPIRIALCMVVQSDTLISIPLSSISAYIKKYNTNIEVKLFHVLDGRKEEKYGPNGFATYLQQWQPDVFAMSLLSTHWDCARPYLTSMKEIMPELLILVGGYQAILKSEETMAFAPIDFLCDGDGEIPTNELLQYLRGETNHYVNGLWEKLKDGEIARTLRCNIEDLATLPFPDYTIYEVNGKLDVINYMSEAHRTKKRMLPVMTGRGCVYNCTYCSNSTLRKMWPGNKKAFLRSYDVADFVDELVRLKDRYDIEYFVFWDELFFRDIPYVLELFKLYREKVNLPFSVISRIEVMDEELCATAASAGCDAIYFGLESGNEEYRRKYLKRFERNETIMHAAENCRKAGIKRITFNIIGMPFETKEQMLDTLEINKQIQPEFFYFFIYIPLKGTKLYDVAEEANLLYDTLNNKHYLEGIYTDWVRMNIKQSEGAATEDEFNEVRKLMVAFQQTNVRV